VIGLQSAQKRQKVEATGQKLISSIFMKKRKERTVHIMAETNPNRKYHGHQTLLPPEMAAKLRKEHEKTQVETLL
jgi:hypothetical protein